VVLPLRAERDARKPASPISYTASSVFRQRRRRVSGSLVVLAERRAKNAARQRERCENDDDRGSNCTNAPGLDRRGARRLSRTLRAARARPRTPLVKPLSQPERERRRHARPRGSPPELAINLAENWQVRWWCEHFGVTHRELFEAIAAVGVSAEAVRRHLRR
jgi:hypothetical protein